MKRKYNVQSDCCKAPILWNVITNDEKLEYVQNVKNGQE